MMRRRPLIRPSTDPSPASRGPLAAVLLVTLVGIVGVILAAIVVVVVGAVFGHVELR